MDRKKDLIITSGGENNPPATIERLLVAHPLIGQALSYGDRRPYVVALRTLYGDVMPAWARARGIRASSLAELAGEPAVLAAVAEAAAGANEGLAIFNGGGCGLCWRLACGATRLSHDRGWLSALGFQRPGWIGAAELRWVCCDAGGTPAGAPMPTGSIFSEWAGSVFKLAVSGVSRAVAGVV